MNAKQLRSPRQTRGILRRDTILDAAASLLREMGPGAVTMQAVAHRAGSSTGSMYHFFKDREELLGGLAARHSEALMAILGPTFAADDLFWQDLTPERVIDALFGRAILYYTSHRDALATLKLVPVAEVKQFQALVSRVICLRLGSEAGPAAARTLFSLSTGTLHFLHDAEDENLEEIAASIPDALASYLSRLEGR
ncbi:TetR/AcrR family transcriptional regulator [Asticcacaulis benevestitus]|uniref:HTH tetR-type domain-containing protein n=1 Tax=Asticcacaulis benevestitus DSM 16100 = ATCC BAA-896 TaxID=1121022 RepID=V4P980_9CAUL|nr:TetR/AcrR family transcriptional regulator [Asticcacaulis benevestitus]ESQ83629.1 hypothetical protein ABENE_20165 [Asticcacaulis benevestitus DSM 16100 = ATCC BAA-896]